MFVMGNFLQAVANVLDTVLSVYSWLIIASALISWVSPDPYNPIVHFLHQATEPVLRYVRRRLPFSRYTPIDFSPWIVLIVITFLRRFLVETLIDAALRLH